MHLLIPFAAPLPDAGRETARSLSLPRLHALLARLAEIQRDDGDLWTWSPPHERALALALGLRGGAGRLPFAARQAAADGIDVGDLAWGLLTPAHWALGTDRVSLIDPAMLRLDDASSRAFFDAVRGLFAGRGFALRYGAPLRWYVAHECLAELATASLDRVIGRNVDAWLGSDPAARPIRGLQSEVQMALHTHPLNERREAQGLLPVNSFWLSHCGAAQPAGGAEPQVDERLRGPALAADWAAWARAWETLDEGPLAELLEAAHRGDEVQLTLCGERSWARFEPVAGWLQRLRRRWSPPEPAAVLASL
jgi:hypothetical protein